eukprot:TRINITY_DN1098_c0_g1::TRINITY_DN1098_c0_g1_i1::g.29973::m.29973 TRINITY_DN1098_c0_g1::TRINITY_DN1098_c0_g1_i1::g.29973  ORF type:complete len:337 (-),score=33.46 TRINITY_DN1098_c0_g1_i1:468-1478(-)
MNRRGGGSRRIGSYRTTQTQRGSYAFERASRAESEYWMDHQARLTIGWNSAANVGDFLSLPNLDASARGFFGLLHGLTRHPLNLNGFVVVLNTGNWRTKTQRDSGAFCFKVSLEDDDFRRMVGSLQILECEKAEFVAQSKANHSQQVPYYYGNALAWDDCRTKVREAGGAFSPQFSHKEAWVARGLPVHQFGSIQNLTQADVSHLLHDTMRQVDSILNSLQLDGERDLQICWLFDERCLQAGVVPFSLKLDEKVYSAALKSKLQREGSPFHDVNIAAYKKKQRDVFWRDLNEALMNIDRFVGRHFEQQQNDRNDAATLRGVALGIGNLSLEGTQRG